MMPISGGDLPALCELQATIRPTADSAIEILVWLPTAWNGKYQQLGNNGFGGIFKYPEMAENVRRGYAVASTDTGHKGAAFDVQWAFGHPEKVTDFVWRGVHELTLKAKRIITAYYGKPARYSYWNGCSNGGGEGLMQAQRFPDEFDGVISGGAAAYWTRSATQQLYFSSQLINNKITDSQIDAINNAVIKACDANDGVVGDALIGDPRRCQWSPKALICTAGQDPGRCLTAAQADAVAAIYDPLRDPVTGAVLLGGAMRGSEWQWGARRHRFNTVLAPSVLVNYQIAFNNAAWNGSTFDLHADPPKLDAFFRERNAIDPDLTKFKKRGAKMIQYMGWDDTPFTPGWTVQYYNMVVDKTGRGTDEKKLKDVQDFYRLYMMPGVGHCGGGAGPSLTRFDLVTALEAWVEGGMAPEGINANSAAGTLERPICPYPQEAIYNGFGDNTKAASFNCRGR
jgi:feruloyl esterase